MNNNLKIKQTGSSPILIFYLLKLFLPVFSVSLLFFVLVLVLGDSFYNLNIFMQNHVPLTVISRLMFLYIPKCISYSLPISMLFAASYTLGNLYAKKELSVIFLSGVSLFRFVAPLLLFSFLLSFASFFFDDYIVIKTFSEKNRLMQLVSKKDKNLDIANVAVMTEFGTVVYTADYYDSTNQQLHGPKIVHRNDDGFLDMIIIADTAAWNNETQHWSLTASRVYHINEQNTVTVSAETDFDFLNEAPENFQKIITDIEEMNSREAKVFLDDLKRRGVLSAEYLVKYYQRFSFPFTIFIVLFLSISFGGYLKKNILLMSLLLSLSVAVLYYVAQMCMTIFASWNLISPIVAAWFPFLFFFLISVYLVKKART